MQNKKINRSNFTNNFIFVQIITGMAKILVTEAIEVKETNAGEAEAAGDVVEVVEADILARVKENVNPSWVKMVNPRRLQSHMSHQNPLMMKAKSLAAQLLRELTSISLIILQSK